MKKHRKRRHQTFALTAVIIFTSFPASVWGSGEDAVIYPDYLSEYATDTSGFSISPFNDQETTHLTIDADWSTT